MREMRKMEGRAAVMAEVSSEHDSKLLQQSRSGMVTSSILSHSLSGLGRQRTVPHRILLK
jgi:hypothetical protein